MTLDLVTIDLILNFCWFQINNPPDAPSNSRRWSQVSMPNLTLLSCYFIEIVFESVKMDPLVNYFLRKFNTNFSLWDKRSLLIIPSVYPLFVKWNQGTCREQLISHSSFNPIILVTCIVSVISLIRNIVSTTIALLSSFSRTISRGTL